MQPQTTLTATVPPTNNTPHHLTQKDTMPVVPEKADDDGNLIRWMDEPANIWANVPNDHPVYDTLMLASITTTDKRTRNVVGEELELVALAVHRIETYDRNTGESFRKPRFVMLLANGKTVSTCSAPCVRLLRYIAKREGVGPWKEPIRVIISEIPGENGNSTCIMKEVKPTPKPKK